METKKDLRVNAFLSNSQYEEAMKAINDGADVNEFDNTVGDGLYPIEIVLEQAKKDLSKQLANKLLWNLFVHGAQIPDDFEDVLTDSGWLNDKNRTIIQFLCEKKIVRRTI